MISAAQFEELELFRRQCFQLLELESLAWPYPETMRKPECQQWLFEHMFDAEHLTHPMPERYQYRVLKRLVKSLEAHIVDPEEDEISNDLMERLSALLAGSITSELAHAQKKSFVTYTFNDSEHKSVKISQPWTVTSLEARSVISGAGTTGLRTWEATLHLSAYLSGTDDGRRLIRGKSVLELGAGTGVLSIICAKYLEVTHVTATDGDPEVIEALQSNLFLNGLEGTQAIRCEVLKWGRSLLGSTFQDENEEYPYDVLLGADVTYDGSIIPWLIGTIREFFSLRPHLVVLIAATVRNEDTFNGFVSNCEKAGFVLERVDFVAKPKQEQKGPFYPIETPFQIIKIAKLVGLPNQLGF